MPIGNHESDGWNDPVEFTLDAVRRHGIPPFTSALEKHLIQMVLVRDARIAELEQHRNR